MSHKPSSMGLMVIYFVGSSSRRDPQIEIYSRPFVHCAAHHHHRRPFVRTYWYRGHSSTEATELCREFANIWPWPGKYKPPNLNSKLAKKSVGPKTTMNAQRASNHPKCVLVVEPCIVVCGSMAEFWGQTHSILQTNSTLDIVSSQSNHLLPFSCASFSLLLYLTTFGGIQDPYQGSPCLLC